MHLRDSAEFLCQELWHLPVIWENGESGTRSRSRLFKDSFEPCKPPLGVLQTRVRLAWSKWLLVRGEELATELDSQLVYSALSDCVQGEACFTQLLTKTALVDPAEVFQDLET